MTLLPPAPLLAAFVGASLVLAATPGPGVLYIVARSVAQGRASALASVAGVALGNLGNAIGAALGLAALFAVSSAAFTVVKLVGAGYLVWLGVRTLLARPAADDAAAPAPAPLRRVFVDGVAVALLNPKTTLFFAAFLPQFVGVTDAPALRSVALGGVFVAIAAVTDTLYALAAAAVAPMLGTGPRSGAPGQSVAGAALRARRVRDAGRWLGGFTFIGLGLMAAFTGRPER